MLIAITVLYALYLTGFPKENNIQKHGLRTRRGQRISGKEVIRQESVNRENSGCAHKFGYLQTRKDGGVPEECVGCPELVKCLLPNE